MTPLALGLTEILRQWKWLVAAVVLLIVAFMLGDCSGASRQKAKDQAALERANAAALRIKAAADEIAAAQRLADAKRLTTVSKERTDAIDKAPGGRTGPATSCLNYTRWVQQNPGSPIPKPTGC